jgi:hypothetical protein
MKKRRRVNQKVQALHVEQFLQLREQHKMSYRQIGEFMTLKPMTVFAALKRYAERGAHFDYRIGNGHNNPRHKINAELGERMLNRDLL